MYHWMHIPLHRNSQDRCPKNRFVVMTVLYCLTHLGRRFLLFTANVTLIHMLVHEAFDEVSLS